MKSTFRYLRSIAFLFIFSSTQTWATSINMSTIGSINSDYSQSIKQAINGYDTIVFDLIGSPFITGPQRFEGIKNKAIFFEEGVIVKAKANAFDDDHAMLFQFIAAQNVHFWGYGATLSMNKAEYIALNNSEYRHTISFYNSSDISIKGLKIASSGGDGIYIGGSKDWPGDTYCKNVTIHDVWCDDHYRQGMSITSVENMEVRGCRFTNTKGTLPEAGVDVEPYEAYQRIVNLRFSKCYFANNGWAGLAVALFELDDTSTPIGITISDCVFENNSFPKSTYANCELFFNADDAKPVKGLVIISNTAIQNSQWTGIYSRKTHDAYRVVMNDCVMSNVSTKQVEYNEPIFFEVPSYDVASDYIGGFEFNNVVIDYKTDFYFLRVYGWQTLAGIKDISGKMVIYNPNSKGILFENVKDTINVLLSYQKSPAHPSVNVDLKTVLDYTEECKDGAPAKVSVTRPIDQISNPIIVQLYTDGKATNGLDYEYLPPAMVLPHIKSTIDVNLAPIRDSQIENPEKLTLDINKTLYLQSTVDIVKAIISDCYQPPNLNVDFDINNNGTRVCLTSTVTDISKPAIRILLLDHGQHEGVTNIERRPLYSASDQWRTIATNLPSTTQSYLDLDVKNGDRWEYKVTRTIAGKKAIGYAVGNYLFDHSGSRGGVIILLADDILSDPMMKVAYDAHKESIVADGWEIFEIVVPRASDWDSGNKVVAIKQKIKDVYDAQPIGEKPNVLYILGHVPLPRAGLDEITPDEHDENKGARGADSYYADLDGLWTDTKTYAPASLATTLAKNVPNDFKWDQDYIPSTLELAYGRVDFADLTESTLTERDMLISYMERNRKFRYVEPNWDMGKKSAFSLGYDNSNDGSYRSLFSISSSENIFQNKGIRPHPKYVADNGPFLVYMQNQEVPELSEWKMHGMNAVLYSSDQSYYGFGDVPQSGLYSRIRSLLGDGSTKNLIQIWTTMAINIFHLAGIAEPVGLACKPIMDHNPNNQILEKPEQAFDTPQFWNRTQFAFYGDPTLRLHQVKPITNLTSSIINGKVILSWGDIQNDPTLVGYHVYRSTQKLGPYTKLTSAPLETNSFTDGTVTSGTYYYQVRRCIRQMTGSGTFINASHGVFKEVSFTSQVDDFLANIYLTPTITTDYIKFRTDNDGTYIYQMTDAYGKLCASGTIKNDDFIDMHLMPAGTYICMIVNSTRGSKSLKVVKL